MKKNKLRYYLAAVSLIVILIISTTIIINGATKSSDDKQNHLSIPNLRGDITEEFIQDKPIVVGGPAQTKKVEVKNNGNTSFFVRVMVMPEIIGEGNNLLLSNLGEEVLYDLNDGWKYGGDGYYYYLHAVTPDQKTSPLFNSIGLASDLSAEYIGAKFSIQIKSETVSNNAFLYRNSWWGLSENEAPLNEPLKSVDQSLGAIAIKRGVGN